MMAIRQRTIENLSDSENNEPAESAVISLVSLATVDMVVIPL